MREKSGHRRRDIAANLWSCKRHCLASRPWQRNQTWPKQAAQQAAAATTANTAKQPKRHNRPAPPLWLRAAGAQQSENIAAWPTVSVRVGKSSPGKAPQKTPAHKRLFLCCSRCCCCSRQWWWSWRRRWRWGKIGQMKSNRFEQVIAQGSGMMRR